MATGYRADNCAECQEGISTERPGCTALDKTFHLDCFRCIGCRQKLAGGSFYAVDGKPYCEQDYIETLDKCANCHRPIMDKILRANQRAYHPECFRCIHCGKGLDGVPFTVDSSNQVHCVECFHERYAPRCAQMPSAHRPRGRKRRIVSCGGDGQKFPYRLLQMRGLWEEVIVTSGRAWLLPDGRPPALQTVSSESPAAQMKATATLLASDLLIDLFIW